MYRQVADQRRLPANKLRNCESDLTRAGPETRSACDFTISGPSNATGGRADLRHSPQGSKPSPYDQLNPMKEFHAPVRCFASSGGLFHECPQASCCAALLRPCPVVTGVERRAEWAWGHLVSHQYGCIHPKTRRSSQKADDRADEQQGGRGLHGERDRGVGTRIASAAPSAAL